MVSVENRFDIPKAQLWAIVEAPTPPFAPINAIDLPRGSASGSTKMAEIAAIMSTIGTGATRYSEMPLRTSSR
ncbi:hypothetical protein D3C87_1797540 [compost metagenome]